MKRIAIVTAVLGMCVWSWGQDKPATQSTRPARRQLLRKESVRPRPRRSRSLKLTRRRSR